MSGTSDLGTLVVPASVVHLLADAARESGDAEALVDGSVRLTYAQYFACVVAMSKQLLEHGVRGRRVATVLGNSANTCIAFFAVHLAGAQLMPLNPLYTDRELGQILQDALPVLMVTDGSDSDRVVALSSALGIDAFLIENARHVSEEFGDAPGGFPLGMHPPGPDSLALLQYTGGSTGTPKGVQLTHRSVVTNVVQRDALLPTQRGQERVLCVMPLFHSYALSMALYLTCYSRSCLVVLPRFRPESVLDTIVNERITLFPGNPTLYASLMSYPSTEQTDWSTVRACYSGSAALPVDTLRRWEALTGAPVFEGYGQTEAGPVLTFNPDSGPRKQGSVGIPVPGTVIEIVDQVDGTMVQPSGVAGEIRARGPQVMTGYLNRPEATQESLRDGWLYTGDVGEFDDDGYLFIRDRLKEMAIISGYNVYPREIEEVLFAHSEVVDAAAISFPDDYRGEKLIAFVVLADEFGATPDDVLDHCRANLAKYKVPAEVRLVRELPKTSANKTDKIAIRKEGTS